MKTITRDDTEHGKLYVEFEEANRAIEIHAQNAKAALNTKERQLDRWKLESLLLRQDLDTIRAIVEKGGSAADVLKFLDTPSA